MTLALDHIVICASDLPSGVAWVEAALGMPLGPGGAHARMGTHNRLLRLGDAYLEVIAIDPAAPPPERPRWFDLDRFSGPPRLAHWVLGCQDIHRRSPLPVLDLARGNLRWQISVAEDGQLEQDGCLPSLIEWQGAGPLAALPDTGAKLIQLQLIHPRPVALPQGLDDPRIQWLAGPRPRIRAQIQTPHGPRWLG